MTVETMRFDGARLELLDQRLLPHELTYVACVDAAQTAGAIRDMVVRGAPAIGCAAAFGIALEAWQAASSSAAGRDARLDRADAVLRASRPTAVNLFWALDRMARVRKQIEDDTSRDPNSGVRIAAALRSEAELIYREDLDINRAIGRHGADLIRDGARVMTHCNAGALATAGHGTALGVIRSARDAGRKLSVIANETRPYLQGARLTAWEMVQERIPVTLVADNMVGHLMQRGEVDLVIVGADRVAANGDFANKIGTYTVAVLAQRHGIPFYVAAPLSTIDLAIADGAQIPIEERAAEELLGYRNQRWAPEGVSVRNPAFDVTPAGLVTGLITERALVMRPDTASIRALFD